MNMAEEMREHLTKEIIPFWKGLKDEKNGGYYGFVGSDLQIDKEAVKGCILNSRILWFFSNAYMTLKDETLLAYAEHAYRFLLDSCLDKEYGGMFWSVAYDGQPEDTTKHIYNQAFAIYALSSYYDASKDKQALDTAMELFKVIEEKGFDEGGYKEALDRSFAPTDNDKLSENGVMADRTMNTLLHVFEAYTELFRVSGEAHIREKLEWILDTFKDKIYNPALH
ncbi:MAG: AGE family epimerase/isomerase, partial [Acetatifactor sp.]|nr:AGE family epimerase/isomerase [Acetatifactor sp.]